MPFYKLTVAYDGTDYCGFQVQPNGPTIQEELMKAAIALFGDDVTITGASRTDSGVHARGQVVLLTTEKAIESKKIPLAMNYRLPDDIAVMACEPVDADWHPRYQPHTKTYEYRIYNGRVQYPQDRRCSYHFKRPLNTDLMKQAAQAMVGTHDFASYSSSGMKPQETTVRTVTAVDVIADHGDIRILVTGDGFLYNMVRIMVGTMIQAGLGKITLKTIEQSFKENNRELTGATVPAKGLTLMHFAYDGDEEIS